MKKRTKRTKIGKYTVTTKETARVGLYRTRISHPDSKGDMGAENWGPNFEDAHKIWCERVRDVVDEGR